MSYNKALLVHILLFIVPGTCIFSERQSNKFTICTWIWHPCFSLVRYQTFPNKNRVGVGRFYSYVGGWEWADFTFMCLAGSGQTLFSCRWVGVGKRYSHAGEWKWADSLICRWVWGWGFHSHVGGCKGVDFTLMKMAGDGRILLSWRSMGVSEFYSYDGEWVGVNFTLMQVGGCGHFCTLVKMGGSRQLLLSC